VSQYTSDTHQQGPLELENLLLGVDLDMYAVRYSNPEPAG
jgi:hypothetical protein